MRTIKLVIIVSLFFLSLIALLFSGALNFIAPDGDIENTAALSLVTYWAIFIFCIVIITNIRQKPAETSLLICTTVSLIIICEIGIRYYAPYQAMMKFGSVQSREFHHIYPVYAKMFAGFFESVPVTVSTNEDGLRSKYSRDEFKKNKTKIMILGDSFTFGLGVKQELAYPEVLEKKLRERFKRDDIAVLNTGIISYSPFLEGNLYRKLGGFYKPDIVIMLLDPTDIGDDINNAAEAIDNGGNISFQYDAAMKPGHYGGVYNFLSPYLFYPLVQLQKLFGKSPYDYYRLNIEIDGRKVRNRFFIYRYPLGKTERYFDQTLEYIKETAQLAKASDAHFFLVINPRYHSWNAKECPDNWEQGRYSNDEPYQYEYFKFFEKAEHKVAFKIYNLLADFRSTTIFPLVFANDPHWNEKGHDFVAELLKNFITDNMLIDH